MISGLTALMHLSLERGSTQDTHSRGPVPFGFYLTLKGSRASRLPDTHAPFAASCTSLRCAPWGCWRIAFGPTRSGRLREDTCVYCVRTPIWLIYLGPARSHGLNVTFGPLRMLGLPTSIPRHPVLALYYPVPCTRGRKPYSCPYPCVVLMPLVTFLVPRSLCPVPVPRAQDETSTKKLDGKWRMAKIVSTVPVLRISFRRARSPPNTCKRSGSLGGGDRAVVPVPVPAMQQLPLSSVRAVLSCALSCALLVRVPWARSSCSCAFPGLVPIQGRLSAFSLPTHSYAFPVHHYPYDMAEALRRVAPSSPSAPDPRRARTSTLFSGPCLPRRFRDIGLHGPFLCLSALSPFILSYPNNTFITRHPPPSAETCPKRWEH
ncbi:hypothetical protein B0H16DRAFT_1721512 [Mycena metata]|uniref:Uncharacterized protein n=1 Tax=Mycena metata TaxID=1033252 RepID=A0AAD7J4M7_9AGAR|nr:hypothetical protein B0H16DRAFT_1721512 [Mycena metata]